MTDTVKTVPQTLILKAQSQMTVIAAAESAGYVIRKGQKAGEADQSFTTISAGQTYTFGPYAESETFEIVAQTGSFTVSDAPVDYPSASESATAAQGAKADTATQPRDAKTVIAVTTATLALDPTIHNNALLVADRAAGIDFTLPAATGSGNVFEIFLKTTITSNDLSVAVTGNDTFLGGVVMKNDDVLNLVNAFKPVAATDNFISLNGTTQGGIRGDHLVFRDIAADIWHVEGLIAGTGTEATIFSAV